MPAESSITHYHRHRIPQGFSAVVCMMMRVCIGLHELEIIPLLTVKLITTACALVNKLQGTKCMRHCYIIFIVLTGGYTCIRKSKVLSNADQY